MTIKHSFTLAVSLLTLGASYAFADGLLNDAASTRAQGGVGNYLFWSDVHGARPRADENVPDGTELATNEDFYQNQPALQGADELSVRQSMAVPPVQTLRFSENSVQIRASDTAKLDEIAGTLKADPQLKVEIRGYADDTGPQSRVQSLSRNRAEAVATALRTRGIPAAQLSTSAKGATDPISAGDTTAGRAENRRVEVEYQ